MTKPDREPGLRISILGEDGKTDEDATEAIKALLKGKKIFGIEMSSELAAKIAIQVAKQIASPTDEIKIKTDGVAINQTDFAKGRRRFKSEIFIIPES